ncbi:MAG: hypothetical protein KKB50_18845 [Planctomycetes bacterium]|nr:hypothetical protein [Planctomycetota bacterium]
MEVQMEGYLIQVGHTYTGHWESGTLVAHEVTFSSSVGTMTSLLCGGVTMLGCQMIGGETGLLAIGDAVSGVLWDCSFIGQQSYGVNNTGTAVVDARWCYWGHPTGPSGAGPGEGVGVSQNVLYEPWLLGPPVQPEYGDGDQSAASGTSRDPVNTATGNFFHHETDLSAGIRGGLMAFSRYYNSAAAAPARLRKDQGSKGARDNEENSETGLVDRRGGNCGETDMRAMRDRGIDGRLLVRAARSQRAGDTQRRTTMGTRHGRMGAPLIALLALGLPVFSPPAARADLNEGLVAYWSFDEGSGSAAYDSSVYGNHGTIYGADWVSGVSGGALLFNGAGDYVDCGSDASLDFGAGDFSCACWVRPAAPGVRQIIASKRQRSDPYKGWMVELQAAVAHVEFDYGYTWSDHLVSTTQFPTDEWTFIAFTRDSGGTDRLYVNDGQECTTSDDGGSVSDVSAQTIARALGGGMYFGGIVDEVRIYNRVLSPSEIQTLYAYPGWAGNPAQQAENADGDQSDASGTSHDPVNTGTGNFYRDETDLSAASRGKVILCSRGYNSRAAEPTRQRDRTETPLGPGWTHSYYIWLEPDAPDEQVGVHDGDGHADYWMSDGEGGYVMSVPGVYDALVYNDGEGSWTLTQTNEDVYQFDADGRLLSITDKNGNVTSFSYTNPSCPEYATAVTDPVGRSLVLEYQEVVTDIWRLWKVTDWTGRYVEYTYTDGYLIDVRDVMGEHITYTYDTNGYLATVTDQRGVTTVTNTYDENGRVLTQLDADGNPTEFTYGVRGDADTTFTRWVTAEGAPDPHAVPITHQHEERYKRQLTHEDAMGAPVEYEYDGMFNRNRIIDRNGRVTAFAYDPRGNVTSATEADDPNDPHDGGVTAVTYPDPEDPNDPPCPHVPLSKTDALGCVTEWQYDDNCNVVLERRYLDVGQTQYVEKSWTYNSNGQRLTETDERGNTHCWVYNTNGLLIEEINRAGNHTWYGYDDLWRRIWVTDGRGSGPEDPAYTTHYVYDNADRLSEIHGPPVPSDPNGIVQAFGYDEIGNRTSVTDGNGNTTTFVYDNNGNLVRVEEPEGRTTWYVYDELGRKVRMYDANNDPNEPGSVYTWYVYDDGGRLIEQHDPAGSIWTYEYDLQGNLTRQEDGAGVWTEHEYDALNRRVLSRNAAGETHMEYDQLGRLTRQTDATGKETEFQYDCLGRLVCVIDAEGGWTEYTYDPAGNLTQIEDARDEAVSVRQYDANNRLIYAEDGNGNFYTYGYDAVGNQTWVIDANGQQTDLTYDAASRLIDIAYPDASWVQYDYDNNSNRVAMHEPEGSSTFVYDDLNRLTSDTDRFGMTVGYSYDPLGNRVGLTYPDAKQVTYGYDAANRLETITDWAARQTTYTYECCSRLDTITYPNGLVEDRGYDAAGRLVSMATTDSRRATLLSYEWVRDAVGNPTSATETGTLQPTLEQLITESEYDSDNRLVESSQGTYEYDANGNLISRTVNGVTTTFTYDPEDRLISQTTGTNAVQHVYDGQSYRIARIENGVATRYVLDRGRSMSHVLCETDAAGNIIAYYIHGPQLVARVAVEGRAEVPQYYHTNDIGSVVALTDSAQQVTDRYTYTPYGLPRGHEGVTQQPFTYVGGLGVMAEADGLYFMRARFYDSDSGRFLSKDPAESALTNPAKLHRYAYALNRPSLLVDYSGLLAADTCTASDTCQTALLKMVRNFAQIRQALATRESLQDQFRRILAQGKGDVRNTLWLLARYGQATQDLVNALRRLAHCHDVVLVRCQPDPQPVPSPGPEWNWDWDLIAQAIVAAEASGGAAYAGIQLLEQGVAAAAGVITAPILAPMYGLYLWVQENCHVVSELDIREGNVSW